MVLLRPYLISDGHDGARLSAASHSMPASSAVASVIFNVTQLSRVFEDLTSALGEAACVAAEPTSGIAAGFDHAAHCCYTRHGARRRNHSDPVSSFDLLADSGGAVRPELVQSPGLQSSCWRQARGASSATQIGQVAVEWACDQSEPTRRVVRDRR